MYTWNTKNVFKDIFGGFLCLYFKDRTAEEWTGNRGEREGMTCSKGPLVESNPWPLRQGQSPCIWGACSTNWATGCPINAFRWWCMRTTPPSLAGFLTMMRVHIGRKSIILQSGEKRTTHSSISAKPRRWLLIWEKRRQRHILLPTSVELR